MLDAVVILKDLCGHLKGEAMLALIDRRFLGIPGDAHGLSLRQ